MHFTRLMLVSVLACAGCSMPSMRVTLSAETGEATTGDYKLQRQGSTYATGSSVASVAAALANPSPAPAQ